MNISVPAGEGLLPPLEVQVQHVVQAIDGVLSRHHSLMHCTHNNCTVIQPMACTSCMPFTHSACMLPLTY